MACAWRRTRRRSERLVRTRTCMGAQDISHRRRGCPARRSRRAPRVRGSRSGRCRGRLAGVNSRRRGLGLVAATPAQVSSSRSGRWSGQEARLAAQARTGSLFIRRWPRASLRGICRSCRVSRSISFSVCAASCVGAGRRLTRLCQSLCGGGVSWGAQLRRHCHRLSSRRHPFSRGSLRAL
jgi:hypothetical protein